MKIVSLAGALSITVSVFVPVNGLLPGFEPPTFQNALFSVKLLIVPVKSKSSSAATDELATKPVIFGVTEMAQLVVLAPTVGTTVIAGTACARTGDATTHNNPVITKLFQDI